MKKSATRQSPRETQESQTRRAERGIVAGYIHELSRRHDHDMAEPRVQLAAEASEGS